MDMTHSYWEENSDIQRVKYESGNLNEETTKMKEERGLYQYCETNLNFSTATCSEDDCEYNSYKKSKVTSRQDPMSHRIIEKRRRDRMNNCLADLSRLIPAEYLKKGRGRIEKTEIIEMAIKHMKYLQQEHVNPTEQYRLGYQECMSETMRFMVEVEGHFPREAMCVRLLNHLQKHCEAISHSPNIIPSQQQQHQQNQLQQQQSQTTSVTTTIDKNLTTPQYNERNTEFQVTKTEKETNNNNRTESDCEKLHNTDNNGISYKYKTSIKMRFSQDLSSNHHVDGMKRQKTDNVRRNSVVSTDNQCSSHSSPPSSELCTRISDAENASGRDSVASMPNNNPLKLEPNHRTDINRYSPKQTNQCDLKHNFNIPIFALHAKGSYYIPLTIDYKTLLPYLQSYDLLEVLPSLHSVVLHPVTINVNFQQRHHNYDLSTKYKTEYISNNWQ